MNFLGPEEELVRVVQAMRLTDLVVQAQQPGVHPELKDAAVSVVQTIVDLFNLEVPDVVAGDPVETLLQVNREVNLSRMLKERGLFRLFMLVISKDGQGNPLYQTVANPDTGELFSTQEEFLGWFCGAAQINHSTVFMHKATVEKLLSIGFSFSEAYKVMMTKPYAIRLVLKAVGTWSRDNELVSVTPQVATRLAAHVSPDNADTVKTAVSAFTEERTAETMRDMVDAISPSIAKLVEEVGYHERSGDAIQFVRHDIAQVPEITYSWNTEEDCLEITMFQRGVSEKGEPYDKKKVVCKLIPEQRLPPEVIEDLLNRLPIKNKHLVV